NVHTGRQIQLSQGVNGLRCRLENVEQPLMRANLKLLARLLVDVRRSENSELVDDGRKRNGSRDARTRPLRRVHDLRSRLIQHSGVVRLEPNSNFLVKHGFSIQAMMSVTVTA